MNISIILKVMDIKQTSNYHCNKLYYLDTILNTLIQFGLISKKPVIYWLTELVFIWI